MAEAPRPRVGVGVFVTRKSEAGTKSFLMGCRKGSHGAGTWALPGGHLEFCETWEACASREVLEETGLEISDIRFLTCTNNVFDEPTGKKHYVTIFMSGMVGEGKEPENVEPDKCEGWKWVTWQELQDWVANNGEKDAPRLFGPMITLAQTRDIQL